MKRLMWLLPVLFGLCGCAAMAAAAPQTAPASPPVIVMSSPPTTAAKPSVSASVPSTEPTLPQPLQTAPGSSVPPSTEPPSTEHEPAPDPPRFQIGDTTPTWRPELAERYPADEACDAVLLLEKWMAVEGLSMTDLEERACRQLILVVAQPTDGVTTRTVCYERTNEGVFRSVDRLEHLQGFVGKNGVKHHRQRNTNTSPAGLWAISSAFGNEPPPDGLKLPWRQVTPNSDWVCDEASPYFNTWQERNDPTLLPWSDDVEHLEDYPTLYAWACVIEFNRPPDVIPDRGCAIFLHCSRGGTGGCVGLRREDMLSVLNWLDAEKNPYILITGAG